MLSIKGREPFIRMQLWLSDANNVERLQALKNERREANKRRRSTGTGMQDNSSDTSSNDTSEFYTSNSPGPGSVGSAGAPPNKKQRVLFSEEQKEALRLAFALDPYPNVGTIEFLATELNLSTRTITNWFHNHRMRLKQQVPHGAPSDSIPSRENQTGAPFDPVQFRVLLNQRLLELQKERIGLAGVPPLQYSPFFANQNLAALISRGLLPTNEAELAALNAFKEQMSGLDLSMGAGLKRERDDYSDDENDGDGDGDHNMSDADDDDNADNGSESNKDLSASSMSIQSHGRSSRRKPAAPQWLNPMWLDDKKGPSTANDANVRAPADDEVIINGVCVMQQNSDFDNDDSTLRVDPQPVDRTDGNESARSDDENDAKSTKNNDDIDTPCEKDGKANDSETKTSDKSEPKDNDDLPMVKKESEDSERWDY